MIELKRTVKRTGPINSPILIIGEAPGESEELNGRPFSGYTGALLQNMCAQAGLIWTDLNIDNVVQYRPPNNKFQEHFYTPKNPNDKRKKKTQSIKRGVDHTPKPELLLWHRDLLSRLKQYLPKVIVAAGDEALYALVGNEGVTNWRGSVIPYFIQHDDHAHLCYIIPIVHPSFAQRSFHATSSKQKDTRQPWIDFTIYDLLKVKRIVSDGWNPIERNEIINPTYPEVMTYLDFLINDFPKPDDIFNFIVTDLETPRREYVGCIGITHNHTSGMCIPLIKDFLGSSYYSINQEVEILKKIKQVLLSNKVSNQNIPFDAAWYHRDFGFIFDDNIYVDSAKLHSVCNLELKHDLGFLTSLYTDMPYYKYMGRSAESKRSLNEWYTYNCQDLFATHEVTTKLIHEAISKHCWDYYLTESLPILKWAIQQHRRGLYLDTSRRIPIAQDVYHKEIYPVQVALNNALKRSGFEEKPKPSIPKAIKDLKSDLQFDIDPSMFSCINPNSPVQVIQLLNYLGYNVEDSQEETLLNLGDELIPKAILFLRGQMALLSAIAKKPGPDNCIRTALYTFVTETERLASRKDHFGGGTNMQNWTAAARPLVCARPGYELAELDGSQAEARVYAWVSGDEGLKEPFQKGLDVHCHRTSLILGLDYKELVENYKINKALYEMRQTGKIVVHSSNYDAREKALQKTLRSAGIYKSLDEVRAILIKIDRAFPGRRMYMHGVRKQLELDKTITFPSGLTRYSYSKLDDNTFRRFYAAIPQYTVGYIVNRAIRLSLEEFKRRELDAHIILQVHDSIMTEHLPKDRDEVISIVKTNLEKPILITPFHGKAEWLSIPAEVKVGTYWGELKELKD